MKLRIFALITAILLLLPLLVACHGSQGLQGFEIPESFDESRKYEITFWAKNDNNMTQVEIYRKTIEDFQKIYPNITVNLRLYTDYGQIYNDVITNISTNTTPNVCITYPDHIATYLTGQNSVVNLDELLTHETYGLGGTAVRFDAPTAEEIVPQFLQECSFEGHFYALPFMRSTEACYINETFVKALGYEVPEVLTWDFVWEVSKAAAATKGEDDVFALNGQKVLLPFIYKSTDNMMISYLKQKNAGYSTEEGEVLLFNEVTEELLKTVADNVHAGGFSTFKVSGYPANFLNAGQCIFAIDSTAGATWMGPDAPLIDIPEENLTDFDVVVRAIPQVDTESPKMISQGPSVCVFNKEDSQEVLASWLFAQYLLTNGVQIAYSQTEGYAPVTLKAQNSADYTDYLSRRGEDNELHYSVKIDAVNLLLENTENTFVTPVFNGSASLRNAAGQLIEEVTKSVRRKKTVDDAYLEKLYADTVSLYRLDQLDGSEAEDITQQPLPKEAKILLITLASVWILMGGYALRNYLKSKRKSNI